MNKQKKEAILLRDGKCAHCGTIENLTVDHIIPKAHGGSDHESNLQALCWECNQKKSSHRNLTIRQRIAYIWKFPELFENFIKLAQLKMSAAAGQGNKAQIEVKRIEGKHDKSINLLKVTIENLKNSDVLLDNQKQADLLAAFQNIEERLSRLER